MAKPLLSRDSILDGALDLLAEAGEDQLSVRKLAAHLHCSPNTLYQQIGRRDELISELLRRQFGSLQRDFVIGSNWQETAYAWCAALRRLLLANPSLTRLMTIEHREFVVDDVNTLLKSLLQQGLDRQLAMRACRVLTHVVFGLCFTELDTPEGYRRQPGGTRKRMRLDDLVIAEHSAANDDIPEVFDRAIRWTIAGIEQERG